MMTPEMARYFIVGSAVVLVIVSAIGLWAGRRKRW